MDSWNLPNWRGIEAPAVTLKTLKKEDGDEGGSDKLPSLLV